MSTDAPDLARLARLTGSERVAVAGPADLAGTDRISGRLYTDPDIFEEEMTRIYERTWVWVAHESMVRNPGDFITAWAGRHPVIVSRDRNGEVRVMLNRCRHRGATVCDTPKGTGNGFTCPYHAWAYGLDGKLRGVPYPDGYGPDLDRSQLGLVNLQVGTYHGMVWATFNPDIEPLEDFLGPARHWIDLFMAQGAGYPIKTQGEHRFNFSGNWKIQLENTTDGYHFPIVHKSWLSSVDDETSTMFDFLHDEACQTTALGNGHSVAIFVPEHVDLDADDGSEQLQERFRHIIDELSATMPARKVRRIVRSLHGAGFNLNLFPNVAMSMSFFRILRPIAVDRTEIRHICLGLDGGPASVNRERLRIHEHFQGPFGFGTPDDAEGWDRVQIGARGGPDDLPILVNRGLVREQPGWDGRPSSHVTDETGMREAYAMWKRMMSHD